MLLKKEFFNTMTKTNIAKNRLFRSMVAGVVGVIALYGILIPQIVIGEEKDPNTKFCDEPEVQQKVVKVIKNMVFTAYTSTKDQTDSTPFTMASGREVYDGAFATNILALGTKVRIRKLFGNKVLTVEDRMNWKFNGKKRGDIWFPGEELGKKDAFRFGVQVADLEILES